MTMENFKINTKKPEENGDSEDKSRIINIEGESDSKTLIEEKRDSLYNAQSENAREGLNNVKDGIHVDRDHLIELSNKIFELKKLNDKFLKKYEELKNNGETREELEKLEKKYLDQKENFEL